MKAQVFVSYAQEDEKIVFRIVEAIEKAGISCWVAKGGIRFTQDFTKVIDQAIRASSLVIWVASKHSLASHYVHHEISTAQTHNKARGLVFLESMDPKQLPPPFDLTMAGIQGAEFFRGSFEENVADLAADIKVLLRRQQRRRFLAGAYAALAVAAVAALGVWAYSMLPQKAPDTAKTALPQWVLGLPAGDVLQVASGGQPPAAPAGALRPQIRFAVMARRSGENSFKPLKDGDALASEKDDYLVAAQPLTGGYLYVFQVDSSGQKEWLFPKNDSSAYSCGENPVKAGEVVQVPAADARKALFLDTRTGVEHIYAVFSAGRWSELEQALAAKAPATQSPAAPAATATILASAVNKPNGLLLRGVGGARPGGETVAPFAMQRLDKDMALTFYVEEQPLSASGALLVVERWFRHVAAE
jgi:hypothetical protein